MKATAPLFEIEDRVVARPSRRVAPLVVEAAEDNVTGVAGIALFGELRDRLGLVEVADQHNLRPIGPGGYSGGECYRPLVELQLAGGDFLSDVSLPQDEATRRLRGNQALPSHTTLFRFLVGADLGRAMRAQAVNRDILSLPFNELHRCHPHDACASRSAARISSPACEASLRISAMMRRSSRSLAIHSA